MRVAVKHTMLLLYLLPIFISFSPSRGAKLRVEPLQEMVVLPSGTQNDLPGSVTLACRLFIAPMSLGRLDARWVVENRKDTQFVGIATTRQNYMAPLPVGGVMPLIISDLSYKHSGRYTCQARNASDISATYSVASITLSLELKLEVTPMTVVADNVTDSVKMSCEMSQYIEPDNKLQWFRNGERIVASDKYSISFENGNNPSLVNGVEALSRVSVLVVSDFQEEEDGGFYHCDITNAKTSASVYVSLGEQDPRLTQETTEQENTTITTTTGPSSDPSTPEGEQDGEGDEGPLDGVPVATVAIAASCVGLVLVFLSVLLLMMCYACFWKPRHRKEPIENDYSESGIISSTLWNDFSPPLPPRPNLKRMSQSSNYYMNEGMDPEKPYMSIPDYTRMAAGYPAHRLHADTTSDNHEYDTVLDDRKDYTSDDEYVHIPDNETPPSHSEDNTAPTGLSENRENSSDKEYVQIPNDKGKASNHEYDTVPTEGSVNEDITSDTEPPQQSFHHQYDSVPTEED